MRLRIGIVSALLVASCAPPWGARPEAPRPEAPPAGPAAAASPAPADTAPAPRSDSPVAIQWAAPDSAALAGLARDSALDAAILDRLASATPPEGPAAPNGADADAEAADLRALFDIDVVNWADHDRVKYYVGFFTGLARERMAIWLTRMPRYEPTIRAKLIAHGLPGDLAYLPLIESGYSATAVSRSRAVGMWQFMRGTALLYGLKIDGWVDERRDIPKATEAAIRYLADLTARFGSPYLAAAAYNGGPGRIQRGLARIDAVDGDGAPPDTLQDDPPDDEGPQAGDAAFFLLADTRYIRRETKDYVPKLIAAALIAKQPQRYGFAPLDSSRRAYGDSLVVDDATGLDVIARLTGTTLSELWAENPVFLRAITPPGRRVTVRVPTGTGEPARLALVDLPASARLSSFPHHARKGETLASLAKRYSVSLAQIRELNPSYVKRAPGKGQAVEIPGRARLAGWVAENRKATGLAEGDGIVHRVQRGETLGGIALRYGVSVARLRDWNGLGSRSMIRAGQRLRLTPGRVRVASARSAPVRSSRGSTQAAGTARSAGTRVHVVRTGETLTSLARRYGVTIKAIRSANNLSAAGNIQAGQRLTIPS